MLSPTMVRVIGIPQESSNTGRSLPLSIPISRLDAGYERYAWTMMSLRVCDKDANIISDE
jgi:hypothetical protein